MKAPPKPWYFPSKPPQASRETLWSPAFKPTETRERCWSPPQWDPGRDQPLHRSEPYWDLEFDIDV